MDYTERMMRESGIDTENGGTYRLPNGRTYDLRPRFKLDGFPFHGDRSAWSNYYRRRVQEYNELADAIREHNSRAFADAFRDAMARHSA